MKTFQTLLIATLLLVLTSCTKDNAKPQPTPAVIQLTEKGAAVIGKSNEYGILLFQ